MPGDSMSNSKKALQMLLKVTQTSQLRLRRYMYASKRPDIRSALEQQFRECGAIEREVHALACQRGWEFPDPDPASRFFIIVLTNLRLRRRNRDASIAGSTIRDSSNNMILAFTHLHRLSPRDTVLKSLFQKLLDSETACIRRMQVFL